MNNHSVVRVLCGILLSALLCGVIGCSGTSSLKGRVVAGDFPVAEFAPADPANPMLLSGDGVGGVRIEVVRDPNRLNREVIAVGTSRADGTFDIMVDAFGAGWMDEQWLFRCTHSRYPVVELLSSMPSANSGRVLRVQMGTPGSPGSGGIRMDEAERIRRELDRYGG